MQQPCKERTFSWKRELKESVLIALIGIPWGYLMCLECTTKFYAIIISATVWVVLWKGNQLTGHYMDQWYDWLKQPVHRLVIGILGHAAFTTVAIFGIYQFYSFIFDLYLGNIKLTLIIAIGVTFLVSSILYGREFLIAWKQLAIDSERMKKEAITAKYESLKNQVNPHFLFNSFNVLTNLVYEDQDVAAKFIKKLSEVYRYVLEARNKELVSLDEELKFVEAYIFLQKIRHSDSLKYEKNLKNINGAKVAPMALQMLVENSIKHNIVAENQPLTIHLYTEGDYIYVRNPLQKKNIIKEAGSGIGLSNIRSRYEFLSQTPVIIQEENNEFIVGLPLIK